MARTHPFRAGRLKVWREPARAILGHRHRTHLGPLHLPVGDEPAGGGHDVVSGQPFQDHLTRWTEPAPGGPEDHRAAGDHLGVLRPPHVARARLRVGQDAPLRVGRVPSRQISQKADQPEGGPAGSRT